MTRITDLPIRFTVRDDPGRVPATTYGAMETVINLHIEKLPEGVFLATSDDIQGLVAQGRTVTETLEIARDVARRLLEARAEREGEPGLPAVGDSFDYPLIVGS